MHKNLCIFFMCVARQHIMEILLTLRHVTILLTVSAFKYKCMCVLVQMYSEHVADSPDQDRDYDVKIKNSRDCSV